MWLRKYGVSSARDITRTILSDVNWSARSYDLTALNLFFWGNAKDRIYSYNSPTMELLKANILDAIVAILLKMYIKEKL